MFQILKRIHQKPPSGFVFVDPDTGYRFDADYKTLQDLITAITQYRINNNLSEIKDLYYAVQDYLCELRINRNAQCCRKVTKLRDISFSEYLSGGTYYLSNRIKRWFNIAQLASASEVSVRRDICVGCPFNIPIDSSKEGNSVRQVVTNLMEKEFPEITTVHNLEDLGVCGVCNCSIEYKTCLPEKDIADSLRKLSKSNRNQFPLGREGKETDFREDGTPVVCWQMQNFLKHYKG